MPNFDQSKVNEAHSVSCDKSNPSCYITRSVSHFICDSLGSDNNSDLYEIANRCPNLNVLECKNDVRFCDTSDTTLKFCNLKEFRFKHCDDHQVEIIRAIFRHTNTKLIPIQ